MRSTFRSLLILLVSIVSGSVAHAQLSGTIAIPSAAYPSLASAVTALNTQGINGATTVNIAAGYTETVPTGGLMLGSGTLNPTLTATNTLTFQKSGPGTNPLLSAFSGGTATPASAAPDGIWTLAGTDYVTINGIDLTDQNAANPATMEYGYGLFKAGAGDGCQNVTIRNCVVTLNRINNASGTLPLYHGSTGILMINAIPGAATTALTPTAAAGANSNNKFYTNTIRNCNNAIVLSGFAAPSPYTLGDQGNDIGGSTAADGNTFLNFGGAAGASNPATGAYLNHQWGFNVSRNTINNNDGTGVNHPIAIRGIHITGSAGASGTISSNTVSIKGGGTTTQVSAIESGAGSTPNSNTVSITDNTISNSTNELNTSGTWYGIWNSGAPTTINITGNTFTGNTTKSTSGTTYLIYSSGAVPGTVNLSNNTLGYSFTGTAAQTGTTYGVFNAGSSSAASLILSGNTFTGISWTAATGTGALYWIYNTSSNTNFTANGNVWNAMTLNSSGAHYCIYSSTSSSNSVNLNNNNISAGYTRTAAAGTFYFYYNFSSSPAGSRQFITGNNISNITATTSGTGAFYGIYNGDGGSPYKRLSGNTISNINYNSTGTFYGIYLNYTGDSSAVKGSELSNNTISNFAGSGTMYALYLGSSGSSTFGTSVFGNTLSGITNNSLSAFTYGIYNIGAAGGTHMFRNRISNMTSAQTTGSAIYGIYSTASTATNIYNNFISDIKTPAGNSACPVYGIYAVGATAYKVFHNTINLNPVSTGANFGATGIYYGANITSFDLRNNIVRVDATPAGSGFVVALRRDAGTASTAPANLATTTNGNIYYAPNVANSYLYAEGTANPLTNAYNLTNDPAFNTPCGLYKVFMAPRESSSFTENNLTQIGTTGTFAPTGTTFAESAGVATSAPAVTTDFNNVPRGTLPDIGALEFSGTALDASAPQINYTALPGATYCLTAPTLSASIIDLSGVNTTTNAPRVYFKKKSEVNAFGNYPADNTSAFNGWKYVTATGTAPNFLFNLNYSLLTAPVAAGDTIQYFVIAQDNASTPNVGSNIVAYATGYCPSSVNLAPAAGPTAATPVINFYRILTPIATPTVSPATSTICPGSVTQLTATSATTAANATFGTSTAVNSTTGWPAPYTVWYGGSRQQFLILASELTAQGLAPNTAISALSFNVQTIGASYTPNQNFQMKVGHTTLGNLTTASFVTGLTTVVSPATYTATVGVNTHTFSTPFVWNGTDNIVVETMFSNNLSGTSAMAVQMYQSSTSFTSSAYTYADNQAITYFQNLTAPNITNTLRPNMVLAYASSQPINWAPIAGLFKDSLKTMPLAATDTNKIVWASPAATTGYTASNMYNGCNGTASAPATVTVLPATPSSISPSGAQSICPGNSLTLTAPGGTGLIYQWRFNGTDIAGATAQTYSANAAGSYTVRVTNASNGCVATTANPTVISFYTLPAATITPAGATTVCSPATVTLNANTGTGLTYQWRLNGSDITGATASTYNAPATGSYTVAVTSNVGCTSVSSPVSVTVNVTPSNITPGGTTTFCVGGSVALNGPTGGPFTYQWRLNGTDIAGANASSYTATTGGNYAVRVTNTSTGCISTTSPAITVTVGPAPSSAITPSGSQPLCAGSTLTLTTNTAPGLSYQWKFNGNDIAGATSVSYGATAAGNYSVAVSSGPGCTSVTPSPTNVFINPLPAASATPGGSTTFCLGDSVQLNANSGAGFTYQWRLNGANVPAATSQSYFAKQAGSWTVAVTNSNGCTGVSSPISINVNPLPPVSASAAGPTTFCQGGSVVLNGNTDPNISWQWRNTGTNITGATASSYTATTSGSYTLRTTDVNTGCFSTSAAITVVSNPRPDVATSTTGSTTICQGDAVTISVPQAAGVSTQWSNASGPIAGATGNSYTATTAGTYTAYRTFTATGCDATSAPVTVTVNPVPAAVISPANPAPICPNEFATLSANTGAGLTYQWTLDNQNISGATSSNLQANQAGAYRVIVRNSFNCPTTSAPVTVVVKPLPDATVTYSTPISFCEGSAVVLTAAPGAGYTYQWFKDGASLGSNAIFYTASTTGAYSVRVTNSQGCSVISAPVPVTVFAKPVPVIAYNGSLTTTAPFVNYQWFFNNVAMAGANTQTIPALKNGAYRVEVIDTNGCSNTSVQFILNGLSIGQAPGAAAGIRVYPNPSAGIVHIESATRVSAEVRDVSGRAVMLVDDAKEIDLSSFADGMYMLYLRDDNGQLLKTEKISKTVR